MTKEKKKKKKERGAERKAIFDRLEHFKRADVLPCEEKGERKAVHLQTTASSLLDTRLSALVGSVQKETSAMGQPWELHENDGGDWGEAGAHAVAAVGNLEHQPLSSRAPLSLPLPICSTQRLTVSNKWQGWDDVREPAGIADLHRVYKSRVDE